MLNSVRKGGPLPVVVLSAFVLFTHAFAENVNVDCSGTNPNAFHSINDALNTLDLIGPNIITVSGVCHENVSITQRDRLSIVAGGGQYATLETANPSFITLYVAGSHNIVLDHLNIQGGSPALYISDSSNAVLIQSCAIQNSLSDGLDIDGQSTVTIQDSTIKNNAGSGIFISNLSQMTLGTYPTQRILITGNGFVGGGNGTDGVTIDGSQVQLNFGVLTVNGNKGSGISMQGGRLQMYGGEADTPGIIESNNTGIWLNGNASATLWSAFRIHNNGSVGISANGDSSITFYSTIDSKGQNAVSIIDGHSAEGIALSQSSSAQIYGPHLIRDNGSAGDSGGGISVEGGSLTIGGGTSVTANVGPGVRLGPKSDLTMFDMAVTHNTEEGILETNLSAGGFYNPLDLTGNGRAPLRCDRFSVAFGDAGTIPGVKCENITDSTKRRPDIHELSKR
jgi:Right handed beta helix region